MGEVVYGIDFRAGKEEAPLCNAPDIQAVLDEQDEFRRRYLQAHPDTAPCEYVAPSDDCA